MQENFAKNNIRIKVVGKDQETFNESTFEKKKNLNNIINYECLLSDSFTKSLSLRRIVSIFHETEADTIVKIYKKRVDGMMEIISEVEKIN